MKDMSYYLKLNRISIIIMFKIPSFLYNTFKTYIAYYVSIIVYNYSIDVSW